MKRTRLSSTDRVVILHAFTVDLVPAKEIAEKYGYTRQGIYKILRAAGVDVKGAAKIQVSCTTCGREFQVSRSRVRKQKHVFCGQDCYNAWLRHGNGNPSISHRQSGRIARKIVAEHFALRAGHIVHHEDRNQYNNHLSNLKVFANQGDHIRYHRGFDVEILWDGRVEWKNDALKRRRLNDLPTG